jgi:hypothetical protein
MPHSVSLVRTTAKSLRNDAPQNVKNWGGKQNSLIIFRLYPVASEKYLLLDGRKIHLVRYFVYEPRETDKNTLQNNW